MITIRTAEDLARVLSEPLDPVLHERLASQRDVLLAYPDFAFEELALFLIIQPGDTLNHIQAMTSVRLVQGGCFAWPPEAVDQYNNWLEVLFILSDDGFGLLLFIRIDSSMDADLIAACKAILPTLSMPAER